MQLTLNFDLLFPICQTTCKIDSAEVYPPIIKFFYFNQKDNVDGYL